MSCAAINKVPSSWAPLLPGGKATDVAFCFDGLVLQADVTVTSKLDRGALVAAQRVKLRKYDEIVRAQGDVFTTFGFAISGAYLPEVSFFIKRLATAGEENMAAGALSRKQIRDRLATTLQVGNALVQLDALASLRSKAPGWKETRRRHSGRLLAERAR